MKCRDCADTVGIRKCSGVPQCSAAPARAYRCSLRCHLQACAPCPDGGNCPGAPVDGVFARDGYWRVSRMHSRFYKCKQARALRSGRQGSRVVAICQWGSHTPLCAAAFQGMCKSDAITADLGDPFQHSCRAHHDGPLCTVCEVRHHPPLGRQSF